MTKHPDNHADEEGREPEDDSQTPFDEFDDQIQEGLEADPRLDSGVSPSERGSDLDFIQMSGLTTPPPANQEPPPTEPEAPQELDPEQPLTFYEEGVADVDSSMAPSMDEDPAQEREIPAEPDNRAAMEHLREMIAELTKDEDEPGPREQPEVAETPSADVKESVPFELTPRAEETVPAAEAPLEEPSQPEEAALPPEPVEPPLVADLPEETVSEGEPVPEEAAPFELSPRQEAKPEPEPEPPEEEVPSPSAETAPPSPFEPTPQAPPVEMPRRFPVEPPAAPEELGERVRIPTVEEAEEAMYLRHSGPKARRRRSGHQKHKRRRIMRVAAGLLVLAALAVGGYETYGWYETHVSNPASLYNEAVALASQGNFREASSKYAAFARRNPNSDLGADGQFAAGFTLQLTQPSSKDERNQVYTRSFELLQEFLNEYPTHEKAPRARTLMGRLCYELGRYQEAIELLRDPELRLMDPIAAVPAVRILARSYANLGQDDSARSYYLQAVGQQDNHTPDVDYTELGTLYRSLAERAQEPATRSEYEQLAVVQWTHAVQSPGIDPGTKKELRAKIEVLREQGVQDDVAADAAERAPVEASPADTEEEGTPESDVPWEAMAPALEEDVTDAEEAVSEPVAEESVAPESVPSAPRDAEESPETAPVEPMATTEVVYQVVAGDNLSAIAAAHGVTVADLMKWNDLSESVILVGQELVVRSPKPQPTDPSEPLDGNEEGNS